MSQNSTISISFKLEGDTEGFKTLSVDADAFKKIVGAALEETEKLKKSVINFAAVATSVDAVTNTLSGLKTVLSDLSGSYAAQIEAETKLAVNMRNTMSAREDEIQSIKDLCAAQQELGVIGDEVQLAGAQELATYLTKKESLEQLIPVMNDMLAQQYGLNASQENAAQIATMLGKVMDGQTGALKRYGYSFDDAQEQILKYGEEAQRAAVLSDVVSASVGGMNAELAKTDNGKIKQLENTLGDLKEQAGELANKILPVVTHIATLGDAVGGVIKLTQGYKALQVSLLATTRNLKAFWASTAVLTPGMTGLTKSVATARLFITQFGQAVMQGTKGLRLFATAWKGMLISTGVGVAIAAVTSIITYFALKTDEATESTNDFIDAQERAKREAEELAQLEQQENSTLTTQRAALDINIAKLKEFNGTKAQEKKLVEEMNSTYGETMGYFSSVSSWYDALIKNSEAYCRQMILEARTRTLANQIAKKEQENHDILYNSDGTRRKFSTTREIEQVQVGSYTPTSSSGGGGPQPIYENREIEGTSAHDKATAAYQKNIKDIAHLNDQLIQATKETAEISFSVTGSSSRPDTSSSSSSASKRVITANPTTKKQLQDNISLTREKLSGNDTEEERKMLRNIRLWEEQLDVIKMTEAAYSRPATLDTLERIDEELQYQRTLRQKSSGEFIADIDTEIQRLEGLRQAIEDAAFIPVPLDELKTYEQLERQLSHYSAMLSRANKDERDEIQQTINSLENLREEWDTSLADLKKPADISLLDTSAKLDEAISYYRARQSRASADERADLQRTINALEKKNEVLSRGADLVNLRRDADEIERLTGKDYQIKVKAMDVDTLTAQIRDLQRMLADTENPVTDKERESIEALIATYAKWRKTAFSTTGAISDAWGEVKNLEGGVRSITDALGENVSAWERITCIIEGFVKTFQSIQGVIALIHRMTEATGLLTAAKEASQVAQESDTVAIAANTAATAVNTGVSEANTSAKSGEAVANAVSSGAAMPFPYNIAAMASALSAVLASLSFVGKFATGGIVGGNSPSGDRLWARVNSGEMILNTTQQRRLFNFLTGAGTIQGVSMPRMMNINPRPADLGSLYRGNSNGMDGANVRFIIRGKDLVGVIANETRIASKSGKRTDIKL